MSGPAPDPQRKYGIPSQCGDVMPGQVGDGGRCLLNHGHGGEHAFLVNSWPYKRCQQLEADLTALRAERDAMERLLEDKKKELHAAVKMGAKAEAELAEARAERDAFVEGRAVDEFGSKACATRKDAPVDACERSGTKRPSTQSEGVAARARLAVSQLKNAENEDDHARVIPLKAGAAPAGSTASSIQQSPSLWCKTCESWRFSMPCGREDCPV